jgi:deaminated glutathione amidase
MARRAEGSIDAQHFCFMRRRDTDKLAIAEAAGEGPTSALATWPRWATGSASAVDPWGEVLALRPEGEGVVVAEMSLELIAAVRQELPAPAHRLLMC